MRNSTGILAAAALLLAAAQPIEAQTASIDSRWQAFLGCWAPLAQEDALPAPDHIICFQPAAGGVDVLTVTGERITGQQRIAPDAGAQTVRDEQCEGTETAAWSRDGARVYLGSSLRCGENVMGREAAGVFALAAVDRLVEVEAIGVEQEYGMRVQNYRPLRTSEYPQSLSDLATAGSTQARVYAAAPLSIDDIVEADTQLPEQALQAMLVHLPAGTVRVDADVLVALSDAGVGSEVIDVIVALAHPERFAVTAAPRDPDSGSYAVRDFMYYPGPHDRWRYSPYGRYGSYGYGYSPYYGGMFGYGYGSGWYGGGTRVIVVDRDSETERATRGRLVKGGGYTSPGRATTSTPPRRTTPAATQRPQPSRDNSAASRGSSSTTNSGSERRAQPRPPSN